MIALTRAPAPSLATDGLVTFVERVPLDFEEAARQHAAYLDALAEAGCRVVRLPALDALPDSVFVEDAAVALPEGLVLCRPGAPERRPEVEALVRDLADGTATDPHGRAGSVGVVGRVEAPARLDGGDVVRLGRRLLVGLSTRTDEGGVAALAAAVEPLGYRVTAVPVEGALHLESVCTALDDGTLLVDPARIDAARLTPGGHPPTSVVEVHPDEPPGANVARAGETLLASASAPGTAQRLRRAGYRVVTVALSEFEKVEGAATCLSLRLRRYIPPWLEGGTMPLARM